MTLTRLFDLTHRAGSTLEISGNGDLGNYLLLHCYMHFHPEMNKDECARTSQIFKQRMWDCGGSAYPKTLEEFKAHAEKVTENAVEAFREASKKMEDWFKADLAGDFEDKLKERAKSMKELAEGWNEFDHMIYDLPYIYINGDDMVLKKIAAEALNKAVDGSVAHAIDVVNTLTGKKQLEEAVAKAQEAQRVAAENLQQTMTEAQQAAQQAAQNSPLPQPFVAFDATSVPVYNDEIINKYLVFDKNTKIPTGDLDEFRRILLNNLPLIEGMEEIKRQKNIPGVKLIEYRNPYTFTLARVNKKGEYLTDKSSLILAFAPTEKGIFVQAIDHDELMQINSNFFNNKLKEVKGAVDPSLLKKGILNLEPVEITLQKSGAIIPPQASAMMYQPTPQVQPQPTQTLTTVANTIAATLMPEIAIVLAKQLANASQEDLSKFTPEQITKLSEDIRDKFLGAFSN